MNILFLFLFACTTRPGIVEKSGVMPGDAYPGDGTQGMWSCHTNDFYYDTALCQTENIPGVYQMDVVYGPNGASTWIARMKNVGRGAFEPLWQVDVDSWMSSSEEELGALQQFGVDERRYMWLKRQCSYNERHREEWSVPEKFGGRMLAVYLEDRRELCLIYEEEK